ncbi:MAG: PTS sugar transporter subunit IIA, partial [Ignavibacteria bacterium]
FMKISDILSTDVIAVNMDGADKEDAIKKIIDLAAKSGKILDLNKVSQTIFEREKLVSTGVGKGFAIPHGKTDSISDVVAAFAITKEPIDFDSIDGEPVRFIFLLVGKENLLNTHIKLLSRISRLMNKDEFRERLLEADSPEEVLKIFREEEKNYFDI